MCKIPCQQPSDSVRSYLNEIRSTPLLTAEEEQDLARRVAIGDGEARDLLVRANLRLVVSLAKRYAGRGLSLEDLIAEGNLGLIRAVEGFVAGAGVRFGSYARYWIEQSIGNAIMNQGKAIRLPRHIVTLLSKWRKTTAALADSLGRDPTDFEVAKALDITDKKRRMVEQAQLVLRALGHTEEFLDEDGLPELEANLIDDREPSADDQAIEHEAHDRLVDGLHHLDEKQAEIIRLRYGLDSGTPISLSQVGSMLGGYSRERIRQLERQALDTLASYAD